MLKAKVSNIISSWNISHIFEWPEVKRAQFVVFFSGILALYMVLLLQIVIGLGLDITSLNMEEVKNTLIIATFYVSTALALFIYGFFIKQESKKIKSIFIFLSLMTYSLGNIIALYYVGVFSIVGGVAMSGGPVAGLLLFHWRTVLITFTLAILASIALFVLSMLGVLPYAALVNSNSPLMFDYVWFSMVTALVVPQVISILYIAFVSVKAWHLRENIILDLSKTDELTQLNNRRVFMETLYQTIDSTRESQQPLSLLMLDLDHFKAINDEYGHQIGDQVIQAAAKIMRKNFKYHGCLARYGGEEFCAILENTPANVALEKAEQLRKRIDEYTVASAPMLNLSASIGLLTWNPKTCPVPVDSNLLLEVTDNALYQAKKDGRNCVRIGSLS